MKKIEVTKGEYEPFYYFFDELEPDDDPHEIPDELLERLLKNERESMELQDILADLYDSRTKTDD
jgi:hypothetical protein